MKSKVLNRLLTAVMVIMVIIALTLVGLRISGLRMYTVLSGSMEPVYKTGSVIYVKSVDTAELKEGDIITFMLDQDIIVTHRITEVVPDEKNPNTLRFRTKGDANDVEDGKLTLDKNVIGVPVFAIPYLGYVTNFIQHPPGLYIAIGAVVIIIALMFLNDSGSQPSKKANISDLQEERRVADEQNTA